MLYSMATESSKEEEEKWKEISEEEKENDMIR